MKYCKKCLQPDTRPAVVFDDHQVCMACRYAESVDKEIDWNARRAELQSIAEEAKKKANSAGLAYDCAIGVSGGKDSTFQALYAKEKLGLRPLLVNSQPDGITKIGQKNLDNLVSKGFDLISLRPNPLIAKQLAKKTFFEQGNIVVGSEYALWTSTYLIADKFSIPLIIQGENAALTLGTGEQEGEGDAFGVVNLNTLQGCKAQTLVCEGVTERELYLYNFPNISQMREKGMKAIYLQYYAKEWSQVGNAEFALARGLIQRDDDLKNIGRYRRYNSLDSDFAIVNQMLKYYKFGFGITTDEVCYDIREGRLSREDGVWLINEYDGRCGDKYILDFCMYIGITLDEFWSVVDRFVNKDLFARNSKGIWSPLFTVGEDFFPPHEDCV